MKVLNFGSLNLDYVYGVKHIVKPGETQDTLDRNIFCGGKGLNQSIALARAGVEVHHAGMVGEGGEILVDMCEKSGVHTHYIWKIPGPSGHTIIQVDEKGQNCILLYGGANRKFTKNYIDEVLADFGSEDLVLLQNEINMTDYIIEAAHEKGMKVILNPSPYNQEMEKCDLSKVSLFLLNEIEGAQITGKENVDDILKRLREMFPNVEVVLTLGKDGCIYQDATRQFYQEIFRVPTIDTTAAGDTFTGYFIAAMMTGIDVREGLIIASKASAIAVTREGAAPSIPTKQEVTETELDLDISEIRQGTV